MESLRRASRTAGGLLLVHLVLLIVPFVFLLPLNMAKEGYLVNAATVSTQITTAVFLLFVNGFITIGIAVTLFPVLKERSLRMALWLLAASVIWFVMQSIDNIHILSMLSLSQKFVEGGMAGGDVIQAVGASLRETRQWVHYTELFVIDCWMFLLYLSLYRTALVPRWIAVFGILTVVLHFTGIPMLAFLGLTIVTTMGIAMGISQLILAGWLLVKGFPDEKDAVLLNPTAAANVF